MEISENRIQELVKIIPNPTQGEVTVKLPDGMPTEIQVFDSAGKLVLYYKNSSMSTGNFRLNLSDKPSGIYTFLFDADNQVFSKKVSLVK